jgi:HK97 family phage prohead protease
MHLKSVNDNGEISGYASVFEVTDKYRDVVVSGAFKNAVADFSSNRRKPKLLWQHDVNSPIGVIEEMYEDDFGLFIKGKLLLDVSKAREVYSLVKNKAIDGFSIGYKIKNNYFKNNKQYITDIDLLEISIVTFPACESAVVDEIKSYDHLSQLIRAISNKIKGELNNVK